MDKQTDVTADPSFVEPDAPVVIFDGVCGLCNHSVDFIMRHDKAEQFLFAANQSDAAQQLLTRNGATAADVDTIYLYHPSAANGPLLARSDAVLQIVSQLPFPYRIAIAGRILPRPIRDAAYKFIAKNRYRWFGKHETCRLPTPEERARFLD